MGFLRFAAGAVAAIALSGPVAAEPAAEPSAAPAEVIVRIDGGIAPEKRWVWYQSDGTARLEGRLDAGHGRFRSRVDFAKVEQLVAEAALCTRRPVKVQPAGADIFTYRVSVRCAQAWHHFATYDAFVPASDTTVRDTARKLRQLASTLAWTPAGDDVSPPDFPAKPQALRSKTVRAPG